eukprot:gene57755-biopygen32796
MVGPRDDSSTFLNKGPPAVIAGARHNCDLRMLHRLCITVESHCKQCPMGENCPSLTLPLEEQLTAMQLAQELGEAYCCSYSSKRPPVPKDVCSRFIRAQHRTDVQLDLQQADVRQRRARVITRAIGNVECTGTTRGIIEVASLAPTIAKAFTDKKIDALGSETFRSIATSTLKFSEWADLVSASSARLPSLRAPAVHESGGQRYLDLQRCTATAYGFRSMNPLIQYISPYEYLSEWQVQSSVKPSADGKDTPHVCVTAAGLAKCAKRKGSTVQLDPGVDYKIKQGGPDWLPLVECDKVSRSRHSYVLRRLPRPRVPVPVGDTRCYGDEGVAMLANIIFRPWTLNPAAKGSADAPVPHIDDLAPDGKWWDALERHITSGGVSSRRLLGSMLRFLHRRVGKDDGDAAEGEDDTAPVNEPVLDVKNDDIDDLTQIRLALKETSSHGQISQQGMQRAAAFWGDDGSAQGRKASRFASAVHAPDSAKGDIRKQRQEAQQSEGVGARNLRAGRDPMLSVKDDATEQEVLAAFAAAKERCGGKHATRGQCRFVDVVQKRVIEEQRNKGQPLKLLVHGRPGVGKSTIGMGDEVAVTAHMATMAEQIQGQTLFSLFGWKVGQRETEQQRNERRKKVESWLTQTRWLIIIVGYQRRRFCQLDPPSSGHGGLCDPAATGTSAEGQMLLRGFDSIVELTEQVRCDDARFSEMLDRLRSGEGFTSDDMKLLEKRTLRDPSTDSAQRWNEKLGLYAEFADAPVICANNDQRAQINVERTREFARSNGRSLLWSVARDTLGKGTKGQNRIRDRKEEGVKIDKMTWLQHNDRRCVEFIQPWPLVEGMPVSLTDHIDKGKQLLKGTEGKLEGLWLDPEEPAPSHSAEGECVLRKLPVAAIVRFPHVDEPVKIAMKTTRWCLNPSQRSKRQQVWVTRKQLPIVPAYAVTAHSSQADLNESPRWGGGVPAEGRLRRLSDLLVFASFDPAPLRYKKPGIDDVIRNIRHNQSRLQRKCSVCKEELAVEMFSTDMFRRGDDVRKCISCGKEVQDKSRAQNIAPAKELLKKLHEDKVCAECGVAKTKEDYTVWEYNQGDDRVCKQCKDDERARQRAAGRQCSECGVTKPENEFGVRQWSHQSDRKCKQCMEAMTHRGKKKCSSCGIMKPVSSFSPNQLHGADKDCKQCRARNSLNEPLH